MLALTRQLNLTDINIFVLKILYNEGTTPNFHGNRLHITDPGGHFFNPGGENFCSLLNPGGEILCSLLTAHCSPLPQ
jgi:hypothetical protein